MLFSWPLIESLSLEATFGPHLIQQPESQAEPVLEICVLEKDSGRLRSAPNKEKDFLF